MTKASNNGTLDTWQPRADQPKLICSEWRKQQIGQDFNQRPGLDDLRKIHRFIKKKASDAEIMQGFGINAETLVAIKKDKYDPIRGISLDNQSKIYKEFKKIEDHIEILLKAINYLASAIFIEKNAKAEFKKILRKPRHALDVPKYNFSPISSEEDDSDWEEE